GARLGRDFNRQYAFPEFLPQSGARVAQANCAMSAQHPPGAKCIMPRAKYLCRWRKGAQPEIRFRLARWKNEGGFGIIELAGDCLHLIVSQALSFREYRELIAGERLFSKDVDQREFIRLHQGAPFNSIRFPSGSFK